MALALKKAARMIEDGRLDEWVKQRYASWNEDLGQRILQGNLSLADLARYADEQGLALVHRSGRQELLENIVNQALFD
ncbi:Xylose isomerase [Sodalis praecaptivus]|nr:Xylose isomerase [Sodalis praecaptivus]